MLRMARIFAKTSLGTSLYLILLGLASLQPTAALSIGLGGPMPPSTSRPPDRELKRTLSSASLQKELDANPRFHARRHDWRRQIVLLTLSLWSWGSAMLLAHKKGPSFAVNFEKGNPFIRHWPFVFVCFSSADVVAQHFEMQSTDYVSFSRNFEFWRFISAGLVGCTLAGFGTIIWFHYLHILIPSASCDLSTLGGCARLLLKTLMHSFCWGTLSNTWGIIGRRLLRGDSLGMAVVFWKDRILGITLRHFYFWPVWQLLAFAFMPQAWLVPWNAFGSFLWNCFMSWMASHRPRKPIVKDSVLQQGIDNFKEALQRAQIMPLRAQSVPRDEGSVIRRGVDGIKHVILRAQSMPWDQSRKER